MSSLEAASWAIRTANAVTRLEHVRAVRLAGPGAQDTLDALTTSRLFLREGQMLHTLMLEPGGSILADAFLCLDEEAWIFLWEGPSLEELLVHLEAVRSEVKAAEISVVDLLAGHVLWSLDGPYAWELCSALLGPEVLGAPYLSFLQLQGVTCFRAGKTGEYGYLLLVPRKRLEGTWARLRELGEGLGLVEASLPALDQCALENWHFTLRALESFSRASTLTPAELQLRWRVDLAKEFVGARALREHVARGIAERVTCFVSPRAILPEQQIHLDGVAVGSVLQAGWSPVRKDWVGWGLIDLGLAWPGIGQFRVSTAEGDVPIETRSPPLLDNRSLFVDPRRHCYATRADDGFPPLVSR